LELAFRHHTAGNGTDLGDVEHHPYFGVGRHHFLHRWGQHAFHGILHLIDSVVNDAVEANINLLLLSQLTGTLRGPHLEADDDGVGSRSQQHVAFRDGTHCFREDVHLHFRRAQFEQGVGQCFHRTVHVALHQDVEFFERTDGQTTANLVQGDVLLGPDGLLTGQLQALGGNFAGFALRFHYLNTVAGLRGTGQAKHLHGRGRRRGFHFLAAVVRHGLHPAKVRAGKDDIAHVQGTGLHQHGGHVAAAFVERGFDNGTDGIAVGVGLQVEQFGFEQNLLQQVLNTNARFGRNLLALVLTTPLFHQNINLGKLLTDFFGVGRRFVNLVEGDDNRHPSRLRVVDGFLGLGHHRVIGRHHDNGDVRHLRTTGTHGRKGFVTRRVEEGNGLARFGAHLVGTDVLRDTAGLALGHTRIADVVKQGGFAVVDVAHDGHNRSTVLQIGFVIAGINADFFLFFRKELYIKAKLVGDYRDGFGVEALVDGHEHAHAQADFNDLVHVHVHQRGQVIGRDEFGKLQNLSIKLVLRTQGLAVLRQHAPLVAAVLGAVLRVAAFVAAELGQRGLNLLLNLLLRLLRRECGGIGLWGRRLAGTLTGTAGALAGASTGAGALVATALAGGSGWAVALVTGAGRAGGAAGRAGQARALLLARASGQAALAHIRRGNGAGPTATRTTPVAVDGRQVYFAQYGQAFQRVGFRNDSACVFNHNGLDNGRWRNNCNGNDRGGQNRSRSHRWRNRGSRSLRGFGYGWDCGCNWRGGDGHRSRRHFYFHHWRSRSFHFGCHGGRSDSRGNRGRNGRRPGSHYAAFAVQFHLTHHLQAGNDGRFGNWSGS